MKLFSTKQALSVLALIFCCAAIAGCGSSKNADEMIAAANDNNVKRLANLYAFFQIRNRSYKGPIDEQEFKAFIESIDQMRLERMGITITDVDSLFIGERDGKELRIRWGVVGRVRGPSIPVIFEQEGAKGKLRVGYTEGPMQEVDQTECDRLWNTDPKDFKVVDARVES